MRKLFIILMLVMLVFGGCKFRKELYYTAEERKTVHGVTTLDIINRLNCIETKLDSLRRFTALLDEALCDETGKIYGYVYPTWYDSTGVEIPKCGQHYLADGILEDK